MYRTSACDIIDIHPLDVGHVSQHTEDDESRVDTRQRVTDTYQDRIPETNA